MANLTVKQVIKALKNRRESNLVKDDLYIVLHSDGSGNIGNNERELIFYFQNEKVLESWCKEYQKPKG